MRLRLSMKTILGGGISGILGLLTGLVFALIGACQIGGGIAGLLHVGGLAQFIISIFLLFPIAGLLCPIGFWVGIAIGGLIGSLARNKRKE